ncbi:MAG: threonine--tRNA ligase, partial [Candidatus Korarchaeota archaeon]
SKDFQVLIRKEALGEQSEEGDTLSKILSRFGFEWESYSDYGHMRYRPLAAQLFDTVVEYSRYVCRKIGLPIFEVKGTAFFDLEIPAVKEHAKLYGDRLYRIETDKGEFVLRYAACHQQFAMIREWVISKKDLPFGALEIADSYRYEQRGETTLSFRLRRFFMPDLHIFVEDEENAKKLSFRVHDVIVGVASELGRTYDLLINVVNKETYNAYKPYILEIVRRNGKPALVAIYPTTGANYYWTINVEYIIIDSSSRPREIGTFQIDIGNAKRFGITYLDENTHKYPTILHIATIGSVERYTYMLMDTAARMERPVLPFWAAPIQVRILPVAGEQMDFAKRLHEEITSKGIRADIDDTDVTLAKKIRLAERLWIPLIIIVGKKEQENGILTIRDRYSLSEKKMSVKELVDFIEKLQGDKPRKKMYFPELVSRQGPMLTNL